MASDRTVRDVTAEKVGQHDGDVDKIAEHDAKEVATPSPASGRGFLVPGEIRTRDGEIEVNADRVAIEFDVANTGDRMIMVGSHYHFYEVNDALRFDRERARGYRLDVPAGLITIFEPGQTHRVRLVPYAGARIVQGFAGRVNGPL